MCAIQTVRVTSSHNQLSYIFTESTVWRSKQIRNMLAHLNLHIHRICLTSLMQYMWNPFLGMSERITISCTNTHPGCRHQCLYDCFPLRLPVPVPGTGICLVVFQHNATTRTFYNYNLYFKYISNQKGTIVRIGFGNAQGCQLLSNAHMKGFTKFLKPTILFAVLLAT